MLRGVRRLLRQLLEFGRRFDDAHRLGQLAAEPVDLFEIEVHRGRGMTGERMPHHFVCDVGIAVAVAADPAAQFQETVQRRPVVALLGQQVLDFGVQLRQLPQERVPVVRQAVLDLIVHRQPQLAQHTRLPQRQHHAAQRLFVLRQLVGRELHAISFGEQSCNFQLAVENALALYFGRMCGEHRGDQRFTKEGYNLVRR